MSCVPPSFRVRAIELCPSPFNIYLQRDNQSMDNVEDEERASVCAVSDGYASDRPEGRRRRASWRRLARRVAESAEGRGKEHLSLFTRIDPASSLVLWPFPLLPQRQPSVVAFISFSSSSPIPSPVHRPSWLPIQSRRATAMFSSSVRSLSSLFLLVYPHSPSTLSWIRPILCRLSQLHVIPL